MTPDNSIYDKEVTLDVAVTHYNKGDVVVLRFYKDGWYAAYSQDKTLVKGINKLDEITLDMLPHIRYFIKG